MIGSPNGLKHKRPKQNQATRQTSARVGFLYLKKERQWTERTPRLLKTYHLGCQDIVLHSEKEEVFLPLHRNSTSYSVSAMFMSPMYGMIGYIPFHSVFLLHFCCYFMLARCDDKNET